MTRWTIIILLLIPTLSSGQYSDWWQQQFFFGRVPSARAEAMGKAYVSIDGDLGTIYYNPAGISNIKGLEINSSYASPYYYADGSYYLFTAAGFRLSKYFQFALSRFHWNWQNSPEIHGVERKPNTSNYTLTLASEPLTNLFIGLNANYFVEDIGIGNPVTTIYLDFGVIKKFKFLQREATQHSANIAASIANFNNAKVIGEFTSEALPVTTRFGANYLFTLDKHFLLDSLKTLEFLIQSEYQMLLNSEYHSAIKVGGEIRIFEILAIRAGYYTQEEFDYGNPDVNYSEISDFTYGFGLQLPLDKLTSIPFRINFDYTSLPQTPFSTYSTESELGNFSTYNLRINWIIEK